MSEGLGKIYEILGRRYSCGDTNSRGAAAFNSQGREPLGRKTAPTEQP
jgi:hypothetical protein